MITTDNPSDLAKIVIAKGLSVRETERLAKGPAIKAEQKPRKPIQKDADTKALEGDLSANLGMKVVIDHRAGQEAGQLSIKYETLEQLDELCRLLTSMQND